MLESIQFETLFENPDDVYLVIPSSPGTVEEQSLSMRIESGCLCSPPPP